MANVHNIRLGFACNSSSTHSLLLKKDAGFIPNTETFEFGWDYWTASDVDSKLAWFLYSVYSVFGMPFIEEHNWTSYLPPDVQPNDWTPEGPYYYVDHQSVFSFPTTTFVYEQKPNSEEYIPKLVPDNTTVEFINTMIELLKKDDVYIIGGNDNGGDPDGHPYFFHGVLIGDYPSEHGLIYARWRIDEDLLTIYSLVNGNRFTLSFGHSQKINTPMLVDIKLTDWCNIGCKYCYQGSTVAGKHADPSLVMSLLLKLSAENCFEVAFGGGEPTAYPHLAEIVQFCRDIKMVANVTSKNLDWWVDPANYDTARKFSAVAASVESYEEMVAWIEKWPFPHNEYPYSHIPFEFPVLNFQVVDGIVPYEELLKMDQYFNNAWKDQKPALTITVLGYKTTGRGLSVNPPHLGAWIKVFQEKNSYYGLSKIDTVIAQNYDLNVLMDLYEPSVIDTEGIWSYYYDCTSLMSGPSSYCEELVPFQL